MIPLGTDAPQRRTPLMNYFLITTCVVIYLISHRATSPAHPYGLAHGWARFMLNPRHLELVQFITYIFLHANFMHILGNMIFLWVFGNQVNDRLGHLAYLFFFLAGGILAGCGQVLSSVHGNPTLGASGSIAAVAGLFLALCPLVNIRVWFFVVIFDVASFWFVLAQIFLFDVYGAFVRNDDVAHWAHLTGYLTGFVTGMVILLLRLVPRDHYDLLSLLNRARRRAARQPPVSGRHCGRPAPFQDTGQADAGGNVAGQSCALGPAGFPVPPPPRCRNGGSPLRGPCLVAPRGLPRMAVLDDH